MKVFLTGQGGFIGSRLRAGLLARGHHVPPLRIEFRTADSPAAWLPYLADVDVVVNVAGIFTERRRGDMERVNRDAPCALFRAASAAGVGLVVQFSALGADAAAASRFHLAKRAADDCLRSLPLKGFSLQPSLVFGTGGASAAMMAMLASLPLVPLPGDGRQRIQPIHVDDVVAAVVALVEGGQPSRSKAAQPQAEARPGAARTASAPEHTLALVGPRELTLREYLAELRRGLGLSPGRFVAVPMGVMRVLARLAALVPGVPFDVEALAMLERGNVADVSAAHRMLGRAPRDPADFIAADQSQSARTQAALAWLLPILRLTVALMWLWAGIVSLWFHPLADSYRLLAAAGVPAAMVPLALHGAAAMDIVLGVLTLAVPGSRRLWQVQILLVLVYTFIIAFRLPEFLTHPFGPIVKNAPILAILWLLAELAPRRRS